MIIKKQMREKKKSYHLWGIYRDGTVVDKDEGISTRNHMNTWHYIRTCVADQRALVKVNTKLYSLLEVREENTGKAIKIFTFDTPDHR